MDKFNFINYLVKPIPSKLCKEWCLKKHYSKRIPRIQYSFGLFISNTLEGIITYGLPATPFVARGICGIEYENNVIELNRLVVNSNKLNNASSILVSKSIKLLPSNFSIIISYADISVGHIGYIYQATNFLYTGITIDMKEWRLIGSDLHSQNVCKKKNIEERKKDKRFKQEIRAKKHRYIFFCGSPRNKKKLKAKLKYKIKPYPKGITKRHENNIRISKQKLLL